MREAEIAVRDRALSLVGDGYIYGAKGQICSLKFRQMQAEQYPDQANNILGTGAKWDGKAVWDCAQLTREAAKAGGVTFASGATSQWKKTEWKRRGEIQTRPADEVVFLFRENGSVMQHTGVGLNDGSAVHAKGTSYGVVHDSVYPWTHWASPWSADGEEDIVEEVLYQAVVTTKSDPLNVRDAPSGAKIGSVPKGVVVDVLTEQGDWMQVRYSNLLGWASAKYLVKTSKGDCSAGVMIQVVIRDEVGNVFRPKGACTVDVEIIPDSAD